MKVQAPRVFRFRADCLATPSGPFFAECEGRENRATLQAESLRGLRLGERGGIVIRTVYESGVARGRVIAGGREDRCCGIGAA